MKKWFIVLLLIGAGFFSIESPAQAQEKVVWDGAEIVKDQSGKMTFTKDVKVYKKDSSGKFVSMVVKKDNYFRVYDVEKYDGKVYYWMSSGYRVQTTDLVVFKDVPMNLRISFFSDSALIVSSREGILKNKKQHGSILKNEESRGPSWFWYIEKYTIVNGKLQVELDYSGEHETAGYKVKEFIPGSDVKVVEKQSIPSGYYITTQKTIAYESPLLTAKQLREVEKNTLIYVSTEPYNVINSFGYASIWEKSWYNNLDYKLPVGHYYISIKKITPIEDIQPIGTYYTTKEMLINSLLIPRNAAVTFYLTQNDFGIISYKDDMAVIKLEYLSKTPLDLK
ncbi:hypothetical protein KD050_18585 [Psychrobacillus sp. INOP01]|uniref:hypothetical protein n=1 Tax=Psychrobacillus sp. INOP01 TaxID=2829187 RepID=UPI001BA9E260|nr:hypothetical protein [Psychrobacillus sp. INOP01]QUG41260.1 hypothetical protein KD050_18585 [Psychrobacillus sp. INOP01]